MDTEITKNLTFQTAGVVIRDPHFGNLVYGWGNGIVVRYRVDSDTIEIVTAANESIIFETPQTEQGYPFVNIGISQIKNDSGGVVRLLTTSTPTVEGVRLSYTRSGGFSDYAPPQHGTELHDFVFGMPTPKMPILGTADYHTDVTGIVIQGTDGYSLNPLSTAKFVVDFATGEILTELGLNGSLIGGSETKDFGMVNASGFLKNGGPAFLGNFNTNADGYFAGSFFGPNASEFGYGFSLDAPAFRASGQVFGRAK